MILSDYWGKVYVLVFLEVDEVNSLDITTGLSDIINDYVNQTDIILNYFSDSDELRNKLMELDNEEKKVIHFVSHGHRMHPGRLYTENENHISYFDYLDCFTNKAQTCINLMNVCYQDRIELPGFKHLFTTSPKSNRSLSLQPTSKAFSKLYPLDGVYVSSFNNKINSLNYKMLY